MKMGFGSYVGHGTKLNHVSIGKILLALDPMSKNLGTTPY